MIQHKDRDTEAFKRLTSAKPSFSPRNDLDRTEFRGLYVAEIDDIKANLDNDFTKTLLEKSETLKSNISRIKMSRPNTRQSKMSKLTFKSFRPTTAFTGLQSIKSAAEDPVRNVVFDEKEAVLDELDQFERKFSQKERRVGYPRVALQEIDKFNAAGGFKSSKTLLSRNTQNN